MHLYTGGSREPHYCGKTPSFSISNGRPNSCTLSRSFYWLASNRLGSLY